MSKVLELNKFNEIYEQTQIDYIHGNHVAGHIKYMDEKYFVDIFFEKDKTISLENALKIIKNKNINFMKTISGRFQSFYMNPVEIKITL